MSLRRVQWAVAILLGGSVFFTASSAFSFPDDNFHRAVRAAQEAEKQGNWEEARRLYELILGQKDPGYGIRARYQHALRHERQVRRHQDISYRKEVLSVDYGHALRLAGIINDTLLDGSVDKKKVDSTKLLRKGLEELDAALNESTFVNEYVPSENRANIPAFREVLKQTQRSVGRLSRQDALKRIGEIALEAERILNLDATVTVMEIACGSCYAIDEYTVYLTPNQLRVLAQTLSQSDALSVGLYLRIQDNRIVVRDLAMDGPAANTVKIDDEIISIDGQPVFNLNLDTVKRLLEGQAGTMVAIEFRSPGDDLTRTLQITRQALPVSVLWGPQQDTPYWYLRVTGFADNTPQHIDQAIRDMTGKGAKGIILDLRQNGGGIVDSAIDTARKFLDKDCVIASAHNQDSKLSFTYYAKNPNPVTLPLMLLIDNDTASAAEVFAGALKDNNRATLIGQTTYGKGCTQCVLKLPNAMGGIPTGGMRVTTARFYSPRGIAYSSRGITPHIFIDEQMADSRSAAMADPFVARAIAELNRQLSPK
jgi:carboxyl-terminal processing protease